MNWLGVTIMGGVLGVLGLLLAVYQVFKEELREEKEE